MRSENFESTGSVRYLRAFLSAQDATNLFAWLTTPANVVWQREKFPIFGREVEAPRQLAWFGNANLNYRYTGIDHFTEGWPDELDRLRDVICHEAHHPFNFVLLNRYANGNEYMGWHRDDERGAGSCIASLSLGATRRFRWRQGAGMASEFLDLEAGSLLLFDGRLQHTLTKTKRATGERINLTFRMIDAY